jgi:hypothetical protein
MLVPVTLQLQVVPDEWTRLPPFVPGERDVWAVHGDAVVKVTLRTGELIISARKAAELMHWFGADLRRHAEAAAELVRRLGSLDAAYPADPSLAAALRNGNSYRFASGGVVISEQ